MPETIVVTTHDLEPAVRLRDAFQRDGYRVELLTSGEKIADVTDEPLLLVLTGGLDEKRARRLAREALSADRVPVLGLAGTPAQATDDVLRRLGLAECFEKPVDLDEVVLAGRRLAERRRLQVLTGIVGETPAMQEVLERVVQIAPVNATVLITGESGTGKELIARGLHALSPRRGRPFIAANVAALPATLLESELFGHEKGSFTGAVAQRKGLFELAHRGTLFLDELGEMPLNTQTKLLRVLESREFMRVGGESPIRVDVRVIAATNQDLRHLVEVGDFRRDLYYRLNVLHIELPPLRERKEDIPLLVDTFIRKAVREHDRPHLVLTPEAMALLVEYPWPGNVRELQNLIESMVVLAPGREIGPDDIPPSVRSAAGRRSTVLPVPAPLRVRRGDAAEGDGRPTAPELEFVFRTLLQLRMDVEDLRREFEQYRRAHPDLPGPVSLPYPYPFIGRSIGSGSSIEDAELAAGAGPEADGSETAAPPGGAGAAAHAGSGPERTGGGNQRPAVAAAGEPIGRAMAVPPQEAEDEDEHEDEEVTVVFRPGMTMQDMERQAILAALKEVRGNRRKAADMLGIGERTLYRKIREYEIAI